MVKQSGTAPPVERFDRSKVYDMAYRELIVSMETEDKPENMKEAIGRMLRYQNNKIERRGGRV